MMAKKEERAINASNDYGTGTSLVSYITGIFESFKTARQPFEDIWQECWYNYLGQYQADLRWRQKTEGTGGRSKAFVKLTTLKCNTAHSKLVDVLFSGKGNAIPFDLEAVQYGDMDVETMKQAVNDRKKKLQTHFKSINMEGTCDTGLLEMSILGTGVLKAPIIERVKKNRVTERSVGGVPVSMFGSGVSPYSIETYYEDVATVDLIPLWEYYVDVNAKTTQDSIGEIHFQRMLPAEFLKLSYQGGYDSEAVKEAARRATTTDTDDKRYIQLADNYMGEQGDKDKRVSTLEFWGMVPVLHLKEVGCQIPDDTEDGDIIEALVVLAADGMLIKCCVNPLGFRPFYVCPYKKRPHVIYGAGVAEAMRDSQKIINSAIRLLIDNKAYSGNGMVGINLDRINTKKTRNLDIYPGKTWYVKGNFSPKDAIDTVSFKDVTGGLQELAVMFERFSDEETGLPKYTSGEQSNFLNKTAQGMSMLMTQANVNLKTVLKNIDNYWIEPIVENMHSWMAGTEGWDADGVAIKVKATGSDSLIAKELKMEQYMKFMQITAAPQDAMFMDRVKLMKNISRLLETDDVMRSDEEIKQIMDQMTQMAGQQGKDIREMIDVDKLYPLFTPEEQNQVKMLIGIKPSGTTPSPDVGASIGSASGSPPDKGGMTA